MILHLLIGVWLAWGLAYPVTSWSLEAMDMFSSRLLVMALAGAVLVLVAALAGRESVWPRRGAWGWLMLAAFFNMSLFGLFMVAGVLLLGPARTPIVIYTMPAWSALFAALFLKERVPPRVALAVGLGLVAVVLVVGQQQNVPNAPLGTLLALLAAISFGIGTVMTKAARWQGDLTAFAGWQLLLGAIPLIPVWFAFSGHHYFHLQETRGLIGIAFLTLVSNSLAYFCWFRVIEALPASVAGITTLVVPCVGFTASALLIGGDVTRFDVLALCLVLASVALVLTLRQAAPTGSAAAGPETKT